MRYALVVLSNGRPLVEQAMAAFQQHVTPAPALTFVCDDTGDPAYVEWMRERWPEARYDGHRHLGHGPAMARAWREAGVLDVDWLLWLEEDMLFTADIDLSVVADVVHRTGILQMVFKRPAHFPLEVEHGGMLERFGRSAFTAQETCGQPWMEHRLFYSLNPHLVRREVLRRYRWPAVPNSEHHFGRQVFRHPGARVGMWGRWEDPPVVLHAGTERTGTGY